MIQRAPKTKSASSEVQTEIEAAKATTATSTTAESTTAKSTRAKITNTKTTKAAAKAMSPASISSVCEETDDRARASRDAAEEAGLVYVTDDAPGITRKKSGTGWSFVDTKGRTIKDHWEKKRIEKIGVPPAYTEVWICPSANGHIQATGRDAKGRKQYRYHPDWTAARDSAKYERMAEFGTLLPGLRERVASDMRKRGLPRDKVLATIVALLEKTLIRVGNEDYAKDNQSFGLTTLRNRHLDIEGSTLKFDFKGKSGKMWTLDLADRRIAKVVRSIQELPGQHLFQYLDDDGVRRAVSSLDVNEYLRDITGTDVTAKDFRTWAGTVLASIALREFEAVDSHTAMKRNVKTAIERVASRLGNTPTICRKCYVHPQVLDAYLDGDLLKEIKDNVDNELHEDAGRLRPEEAALLGLLSRRISRDLAGTDVAGPKT